MNRLKKAFRYSVIFSGLVLVSCSKDEEPEKLVGNWIQKSSFDGPARSSAVSFTIDNLVYVTTGYTGDDHLKDLWVYNATEDFWEQKADFIGVKRSSSSAFELNGKGYVGLGYDGTNRLKDFYEYDPAINAWTQKSDFAGTARYGAVGFQVAGKAFFGTGYDGNYLKDFYQYDAVNNSWSPAFGFGGNKRRNATVFIIGDRAYLGTGSNNNVNQIDFWEYNGTSDVWTRKRDIHKGEEGTYNYLYDVARSNGCSFVMNGMGYVVGGSNSTSVWQYNPLTDFWSQKTNLEASGRSDAIGFSVNNRGYVMLGRLSTNYFDDLFEFKPNDVQVDND